MICVFDARGSVSFAIMSFISVMIHARPSSADPKASLSSVCVETSYTPVSVGACDDVGADETVGLDVVGTGVGLLVGDGMGTKVGCTVVGMGVGSCVMVGDGMGTGVGLLVGDGTGIKVGRAVVGTGVGPCVTVGGDETVGKVDGVPLVVDEQYPQEESHSPLRLHVEQK